MNPTEVLLQLLRPAGAGVYVVSTGVAEQRALQERLYGVTGEAAVAARFRDQLERLSDARVLVLGVPSDVGAGYLRGANMGPQAIRLGVLEQGGWPDGVVDVGDVLVVPQLLHDDMLTPKQIEATRRACYPGVSEALPVSPLSKERRALELLLGLAPAAKLLVLGGDHSCAWPVVEAWHACRSSFGIVQVDAHTDLLSERLGVRYCFATWSYHANALVGRGHLTQVGIRATRYPREHWERELGVRQFWAAECLRDPAAALDAITAHVKAQGLPVYLSNDVDGTDARWVSATGTPEPHGLEPDFVLALIDRLAATVGLCAGDVMELAPPLGQSSQDRATTVATAVSYALATARGLLRSGP